MTSKQSGEGEGFIPVFVDTQPAQCIHKLPG